MVVEKVKYFLALFSIKEFKTKIIIPGLGTLDYRELICPLISKTRVGNLKIE